MKTGDKTLITYIYKHELSNAIATALVLRNRKRLFPEELFPKGIYKRDQDGSVMKDENGEDLFIGRVYEKMVFDKYFIQGLIDQYIIVEQPRSQPNTEVTELVGKNKNIIVRIKEFFSVFVF